MFWTPNEKKDKVMPSQVPSAKSSTLSQVKYTQDLSISFGGDPDEGHLDRVGSRA